MLAIRLANNVAPTDEAIERECSVATASVIFAVGVLADLTHFEGVHAREANALAADLDGIAVNRRGLPNDQIRGGTSRGKKSSVLTLNLPAACMLA